jgi:hypothetical protein
MSKINIKKVRSDLTAIGITSEALNTLVDVLECADSITPACLSLLSVQCCMDENLLDLVTEYLSDIDAISSISNDYTFDKFSITFNGLGSILPKITYTLDNQI